jgi:hypothetical protein
MIMLRQIQQAILPAAEKTQPILLGWNCSSMRMVRTATSPHGSLQQFDCVSTAMRFQRESPLQAKVGTVPVALTEPRQLGLGSGSSWRLRMPVSSTSAGTIYAARLRAAWSWREWTCRTVQEPMGHRTIQVTMRYAHLAP